MPEELGTVEEKPVETKKSSAMSKVVLVAFLAGVGTMKTGEELVLDPAQEAKVEAITDSISVAELSKADVRAVVALENNSGEKQNPYDKFNPLKYYKAGDSVIVTIRDGATDSLMCKKTVIADVDGSLFIDRAGMVAPDVVGGE